MEHQQVKSDLRSQENKEEDGCEAEEDESYRSDANENGPPVSDFLASFTDPIYCELEESAISGTYEALVYG
jgi:hypothetical protein